MPLIWHCRGDLVFFIMATWSYVLAEANSSYLLGVYVKERSTPRDQALQTLEPGLFVAIPYPLPCNVTPSSVESTKATASKSNKFLWLLFSRTSSTAAEEVLEGSSAVVVGGRVSSCREDTDLLNAVLPADIWKHSSTSINNKQSSTH